MATNGKPRLGTPVTPVTPTIASQINRSVPPKPSQPPSIPPPAPVIPVSLLQPNEQRLLITSFFGLLEVSSLDIGKLEVDTDDRYTKYGISLHHTLRIQNQPGQIHFA
jgi:hypothetical protein